MTQAQPEPLFLVRSEGAMFEAVKWSSRTAQRTHSPMKLGGIGDLIAAA